MKKVIVRIKGGIGNQLFMYAAARRLALVNNAKLVIDDVSGFVRDKKYQRHYALDHFSITARKATPQERLEPFERFRRALLKYQARKKPFSQRRYIEQEKNGFDPRLLALRFDDTIYLDGYWQSENYFKDIENVIRADLEIIPPNDERNRRMAQMIQSSESVALHVRWFDPQGTDESHNASVDYYTKAISLISDRVASPHFFIFSDDPVAVQNKILLTTNRSTIIMHNQGDKNAYADLWLMTQCKHFIIANSTFSWWGAWLSPNPKKMVIAPKMNVSGITWWQHEDIVPSSWLAI